MKPKGKLDLGQRAVETIERLSLVGDYAGQRFKLRPWQADITRRLFGTVRPDGLRQYRRAFIALPRKQAKTTLVAGWALHLLLGDGRQKRGQQIYSASGDREQAAIIFRTAAQMIRADPWLSDRCTIYDSYKRLEFEPLGNTYQALSSEAGTKHGLSPSAVLFDEVHVLPNRDLHDVLTTGFGARTEPLTVYITTAGWDRQSLCWELWDYARKVRDGLVNDPTLLPVLYEADPLEDWTSEEVWRRVMPALGDFCSIEFIREECQRAKELPSYENTFRQLYLNQWTQQAVRWLPMDKWEACGGSEEITLERFRGRPVFAGLDLSSTTDLTAFVLVSPADDGRLDIFPYFWCPGDTARVRSRRDRVDYLAWASAGVLTLTPGSVIDYGHVRETVAQVAETCDLRKILIDPYNATQLALDLQSYGLPVEHIRQGYLSLSPPAKELEKLVLSGGLRHGNHPVLTWCASNVTVARDPAGNIKPDKSKSTDRIDGIAALVNALAAWSAEGTTVYDERGLLAI